MTVVRSPYSFPKQFRLLRRVEFRKVYEEGRRRSSRLCTAFFLANNLPYSRLGITVPGSVGKAVLRNRIKRRLREVFRLNRASLAAGWDVVLNPRPPASEVEFSELTREVLRLFPTASPPPAKDKAP